MAIRTGDFRYFCFEDAGDGTLKRESLEKNIPCPDGLFFRFHERPGKVFLAGRVTEISGAEMGYSLIDDEGKVGYETMYREKIGNYGDLDNISGLARVYS